MFSPRPTKSARRLAASSCSTSTTSPERLTGERALTLGHLRTSSSTESVSDGVHIRRHEAGRRDRDRHGGPQHRAARQVKTSSWSKSNGIWKRPSCHVLEGSVELPDTKTISQSVYKELGVNLFSLWFIFLNNKERQTNQIHKLLVKKYQHWSLESSPR